MVQRRKIKNKLPRSIAANDTWAMDISFYTTANNIIHPFLGIIDHGSRKLLVLHTIINKSSWTLLDYLCISIGKNPAPKNTNSIAVVQWQNRAIIWNAQTNGKAV